MMVGVKTIVFAVVPVVTFDSVPVGPGYRRRGDRGLVVQPVRHARGHRVERLQSHRGRHRSCGFLGGLPRDPATHCVIPIRTFYTTGMEHSPTSATGTGWERTPWHATQRAAWEVL